MANPAAPVLLGSLPGGDVRDVALQGTYAYLADGSRSFTSVDLGSPATPVLRNSTVQSLGGLLNDVAVQGSFALGADVFFVNGVPVINIDSPANPVPRAVLNFASFRDDDGQGIAADAGYVYLVGAIGSAFIENGTTGNSRMYIGQYIAIEDLGGVAPTISITQPQAGAEAVEGSSLSVRAIADDDIAVASVTFLVNGAPASTVTSEPYEALVTVPPVPGPLVIGARAIDFGGNSATATTVSVAVIPDPLTTVTGLVVDKNGQPVDGAAVESPDVQDHDRARRPLQRAGRSDGPGTTERARVGGDRGPHRAGHVESHRPGAGRHHRRRHHHAAECQRAAAGRRRHAGHDRAVECAHRRRHPGDAASAPDTRGTAPTRHWTASRW